MELILLGVLPVFAMIALGWGLRASGFLPEASWPPIERITYFVFYPAFLAPAAWNADFADPSAGALAAACLGAVFIVGLLTLAARPLLKIDGPSFTSVFQGVMRWNSFIFMPMVLAILGQEAAGMAAIALGSLVPFINVMCVFVLARWGEGQGATWASVGKGLAQNPVIISCGIGLILNLLRVPQPPVVMSALGFLSDAALTMGLITAGAGLSFRYAFSRPTLIGAVSAVKLIAMPLLMWSLCRALGGSAMAQGVAVICGSAPGAAASYVLARQMGGDARLMAGIIAFTTLASVVTIPLFLAFFHLG